VRRVLFITYYWPPSGGSGVQRSLKFVKYLRSFGWHPVVFTIENGEYPVYDYSLEKQVPDDIEVIKISAWEPYKWYNSFIGGKGQQTHTGFIKHNKKESLLEKIAVWIRGNLFIPDARRFWIRPSVKYLNKYLRKNPVDIIFSSGPPHSAHIIAMRLKEKFSVPWIADFRDPWTGVYYYQKLRLTKRADRLNRKLERDCLDMASRVVVVGETMKRDFEKITETPVHVITNGFDPDDYKNLFHEKTGSFSITYTGMFFRDQNPEELWEVLREMKNKIPGFEKDLEIRLTGCIDTTVLESIKANGLNQNLKLSGYIPRHELAQVQAAASLLLLSINRVDNASYIITGKLFDYLAVKRPILAFCPEGSDVENIIKESGVGWALPFNQKGRLCNLLEDLYRRHKKGQLELSESKTHKFSRRELTASLSELFEETVSGYSE